MRHPTARSYAPAIENLPILTLAGIIIPTFVMPPAYIAQEPPVRPPSIMTPYAPAELNVVPPLSPIMPQPAPQDPSLPPLIPDNPAIEPHLPA